MYTPKFNQVSDRAILIEAMRAYSFAILFGPIDSAESAGPHRATHLPVVVKDEGKGAGFSPYLLFEPNWSWALAPGLIHEMKGTGFSPYITTSYTWERASAKR